MKKIGIIGFFDILGYQEIIMNNNIEEVSNIITDIILELPPKVQEEILKIFEEYSSEIDESTFKLIENTFKTIDYLIISDSILIFLPIEESKYEKFALFHWMTFLFYCCFFLSESFRKGLPLRGAIEYGEYYVRENCFAGKSIMKSYSLSNNLDFSGCVLCENAAKKIKPLIDKKLINIFVLEYLAPLKNNIEKNLFLLNWLATSSLFDVRQYIFEAFHAYNKNVPICVTNKLNNTEKIIRYFLLKNKARKNKIK